MNYHFLILQPLTISNTKSASKEFLSLISMSAVRFSPRRLDRTQSSYSHYYRGNKKHLNGKCLLSEIRKAILMTIKNQALSVLPCLLPPLIWMIRCVLAASSKFMRGLELGVVPFLLFKSKINFSIIPSPQYSKFPSRLPSAKKYFWFMAKASCDRTRSIDPHQSCVG